MLGAISGDIVGSRFEFNNHRSKDFELFTDECFVTDDSIMTLAIGQAILRTTQEQLDDQDMMEEDYWPLRQQAIKQMQTIGRAYPDCGFGGSFIHWIFSAHPEPYHSFGNGAAMRISPAAWFARSEDELKPMVRALTEVTHNHGEGLKGAEATAKAIFMAKQGADKAAIASAMKEYYNLNFTIDGIRGTYSFNETCQETVPQAIVAFLEATSFEDAIRTAISVGGDSDTLAAITGSIAETYYGIPDEMKRRALSYLDPRLRTMFDDWEMFLQAK